MAWYWLGGLQSQRGDTALGEVTRAAWARVGAVFAGGVGALAVTKPLLLALCSLNSVPPTGPAPAWVCGPCFPVIPGLFSVPPPGGVPDVVLKPHLPEASGGLEHVCPTPAGVQILAPPLPAVWPLPLCVCVSSCIGLGHEPQAVGMGAGMEPSTE